MVFNSKAEKFFHVNRFKGRGIEYDSSLQRDEWWMGGHGANNSSRINKT